MQSDNPGVKLQYNHLRLCYKIKFNVKLDCNGNVIQDRTAIVSGKLQMNLN